MLIQRFNSSAALRVDELREQRQALGFTLPPRGGHLLPATQFLRIVDVGIVHLQLRFFPTTVRLLLGRTRSEYYFQIENSCLGKADGQYFDLKARTGERRITPASMFDL